jgi:hypothetical protein
MFKLKKNCTTKNPTPKAMDHENKCVTCGINLGNNNPRQYCCKTYCPNEIIELILENFLIKNEQQPIKLKI